MLFRSRTSHLSSEGLCLFDAHLFLGLLSYWVVNTIRYRLKTKGETCFWTEIVRRMSTQKAVTTEGTNVLGEKVQMRLCSEPTKVAEDIYDKLGYKKMPFRKSDFVVHRNAN